MTVYELNMDGLVGPTHHYAGLATGNMASINNALTLSNPQAAARQGLEKMRLLHNMGLKQGLMPPHQRPNLELLYQLGFKGTPGEQLKKAGTIAPQILSASYSTSSMWTANAATISPSKDTQDQKIHFTAANLISNLHRHQEASFSKKLLEFIFADPQYFRHHSILPQSTITADEGAANHNRLCLNHSSKGLHLFVYGKKALGTDNKGPKKYPPRQTREASEAIVRNHLLAAHQVVLAQQNPLAIDQGVFHNDVISVANESVLLLHEHAFYDQKTVLKELHEKATFPLKIIEITQEQVSLEDAISSYLFNSQIITLPHQKEMILIAPSECEKNSQVKTCIETLISDTKNPINKVLYVDLKQSMLNGGGPACLRLRIPINEQEYKAMHQGVIVTNQLLDDLDCWVLKHYRTQLAAPDLMDPELINESFTALDELTQLLKLGAIYPFQS